MKKTTKRLLFSGLALSLLFFLSGCVQQKNGVPTGEGWVYKFLVAPMGGAIKYFANDLGLGFGMAIITVTVIVRLFIILPLSISQIRKSSLQAEKMAYLKPVFDPIQERMKNAKTQDEKMAAQTEYMAAQRHYGLSMLGGIGCLPILIQMPFFSALFYAAKFTEGISTSTFFGINLGQTSLVLTIITGILYFIQSYLSIQGVPEAQKQQMKTMMYVTPLMMVFFMMSSPAGVGLYWFVGGIFTILQQLLTNYYIKPRLRKQIAEEFEKNPPKPFKSGAVPKDVTPNQQETAKQKAIANKQAKAKRNAGKQRKRH